MTKNGTGDQHNVEHEHLHTPAMEKLAAAASHKPRILLLYGSLCARSYSRFLTMQATVAGTFRINAQNITSTLNSIQSSAACTNIC